MLILSGIGESASEGEVISWSNEWIILVACRREPKNNSAAHELLVSQHVTGKPLRTTMIYLNKDLSGSSDSFLAWLFPLTYFLHIAEEYWADFPAYLLQTQGITLSNSRFVLLQILGLLLMIVGVYLSRKLGFSNRMLLVLAAIVIGNSLIHIFRSIRYGTYEPGLVTAVFLWLPVGLFTLVRIWQHMNRRRYFVGAAIGIAICAAVEIITIL